MSRNRPRSDQFRRARLLPRASSFLRLVVSVGIGLTVVAAISSGPSSYPHLLAPSSAQQGWSPLTPFGVDRGGLEMAISCSGPQFCAVIDDGGNAFTWNGTAWSSSTQVASFAGAPYFYNPPGRLSLSCPTSNFCMAMWGQTYARWNGTSWSATSMAPTTLGGGGPSSFPENKVVDGLSCTSSSLCFFVSGSEVYRWNGSSWSSGVDIDGSNLLSAISCVVNFCVAVDRQGNRLTWDGSTWSLPLNLDGASGLVDVSCGSSNLCVAEDDSVYQQNTYLWNGTAWYTDSAPGALGQVERVACNASICFAVSDGQTGYEFDGHMWSAAGSAPSVLHQDSLSCPPSSNLCISVGLGIVTTWNGGAVDAVQLAFSPVDAVSCASAEFCVGVDYDGFAVEWNGAVWSQPSDIDGTAALLAISCPKANFCGVLDSAGNFLTWDGNTWSAVQSVGLGGGEALSSLSCLSSAFCAAVYSDGLAYTWSGGTSWTSAQIAGLFIASSPLFGQAHTLSCSSASFCVVLDDSSQTEVWDGQAWSNPNPTGLGQATSIDCPSVGQCLVTDESGVVATGDGTSWSAPISSGGHGLFAASCASVGQCSISDSPVFTGPSTSPYSIVDESGSQWTVDSVPVGVGFNGSELGPLQVSCSPDGGCLAVDPVGGSYSVKEPPGGIADNRLLLGSDNPAMNTPYACSGDPVNCATGNFSETDTDVAVPGRGVQLDLTRTYNSLAAGTPGRFGNGWTDSYAMGLAIGPAGDVTVTQENGSIAVFSPTASGGYAPPPYTFATLMHNADGTWTFTRRGASVFQFSSAGQLTTESDPNGYATRLGYDALGQLVTVTDPAGRELVFAYGPNGLVSSTKGPSGAITTYGYDASGNLTDVRTPAGAETRYAYTSSHLLSSITDPMGHTIENTYDGVGRVTRQVDPLGRATTYVYGPSTTAITLPNGSVTLEQFSNDELTTRTLASGTTSAQTWRYSYDAQTQSLISQTDPAGGITQYAYDAQGHLIQTIDPIGRKTSTTYNTFGEPTQKTDPGGEVTSYSYDGNGNLLSSAVLVGGVPAQTTTYLYGDPTHPGDVTTVVQPDGGHTQMSYDAAGDLVRVVEPGGGTTAFGYDQLGHEISVTGPDGFAHGADPSLFTSHFVYDASGDLVSSTDGLGHTTRYTYDLDGNVVSTTDPTGATSYYFYDADNEPVGVQGPGGSTTEVTYDGSGNVSSTTDANGHRTTYEVHNLLGQEVSSTNALGQKWSYTYDGDGRLLTMTDPSGRTTTKSYDGAGQVTAIAYSGTSTPGVQYTYDGDGRVLTMTDGTGVTRYAYDSLGRLASATDGAGSVVRYGYDTANQMTSITYPGGKSVTMRYNSAGEETSETDWLGNTTRFGYDAAGNLLTTAFPTLLPTVQSATYDSVGQLASIRETTAGITTSGETYTRDADGRIIKTQPMLPLIGISLPGSQDTYDSSGRLASDGLSSYTYDAAGNITQMSIQKPMVYNSGNELTSVGQSPVAATLGYNAEGDRTSQQGPGPTHATTFSFNQVNELTGVSSGSTVAAYSYNGLGLRTSKSVTRPSGTTSQRFVWSTGTPQSLLLSDGQASFVYGPDGLPVEEITSSGTVYYYHHDNLGSTTELTNRFGLVVAKYRYSPYGDVEVSSGAVRNPLLYAGQYQDAESGLIYMRSRYYDPDTGQFLTVDPLVSQTGQPYSYAGDNPANGTDPSGMVAQAQCPQSSVPFWTDCYYSQQFNALAPMIATLDEQRTALQAQVLTSQWNMTQALGCGGWVNPQSRADAVQTQTLISRLNSIVLAENNDINSANTDWQWNERMGAVAQDTGVVLSLVASATCLAGPGLLVCTAVGLGATALSAIEDVANHCSLSYTLTDVGEGVFSTVSGGAGTLIKGEQAGLVLGRDVAPSVLSAGAAAQLANSGLCPS